MAVHIIERARIEAAGVDEADMYVCIGLGVNRFCASEPQWALSVAVFTIVRTFRRLHRGAGLLSTASLS